MPYVYSTCSNDQVFVEYHKNEANSQNEIVKRVLINGGANVAPVKRLVTPRGIPTKITEEELEWLKAKKNFQHQVKAGFLSFSDHNVDAEVAAADMNGRDLSAPLVPQDYQKRSDGDEAGAKPVEGDGRSMLHRIRNKLAG